MQDLLLQCMPSSYGVWAYLLPCMWDLRSLARGSNPCLLHCKTESQPLDHQGSCYEQNLAVQQSTPHLSGFRQQ